MNRGPEPAGGQGPIKRGLAPLWPICFGCPSAGREVNFNVRIVVVGRA